MADHTGYIDRIKANFTTVRIGRVSYAFSFTTLVAYNDGTGWKVSDKHYSPTTTGHTNTLNRERIPHDEWVRGLEDLAYPERTMKP